MKKIAGVMKFIKLFVCSIEFLTIILSAFMMYYFIMFREYIYVVGFITGILSIAVIAGIYFQVRKMMLLTDCIEERKNLKKSIIGEELIEIIEEKHQKNEKSARKAKRYVIHNGKKAVLIWNQNRKEFREEVSVIDISRSGIKIKSNHKLTENLRIEFLNESEKIEGKVVRDGVIEEENIYFYGIKFVKMINGDKVKSYAA